MTDGLLAWDVPVRRAERARPMKRVVPSGLRGARRVPPVVPARVTRAWWGARRVTQVARAPQV